MVAGYRQAAVHAREGGLDGVEVCAGFGYLPTQFLSAHANARTDAYGGSFTNRLRFLREVLEAMREGIGADGAVGCRLTDESGSYDGTDTGRRGRGGGRRWPTTAWRTTSRSRSAARPPTAARPGSCRRRPRAETRSPTSRDCSNRVWRCP